MTFFLTIFIRSFTAKESEFRVKAAFYTYFLECFFLRASLLMSLLRNILYIATLAYLMGTRVRFVTCKIENRCRNAKGNHRWCTSAYLDRCLWLNRAFSPFDREIGFIDQRGTFPWLTCYFRWWYSVYFLVPWLHIPISFRYLYFLFA